MKWQKTIGWVALAKQAANGRHGLVQLVVSFRFDDRTGLAGELSKNATLAVFQLSAGVIERRARRLVGNVLGEEFVEYLRPIDLVGFGRFRAFLPLERLLAVASQRRESRLRVRENRAK